MTIRNLRVAFVLATTASIIGLSVETASAGRLMASGHDSDSHCGRVSNEPDAHQQCHFFKVAFEWVRAGAPDRSKPVLVLDRGALDVVTSLDRIYGAGVIPRRVIDPRSAAFRSAPINTGIYSAVIVASSKALRFDETAPDLDEVDSTPDSDAIKARAGDLRAFFDAGGGIFLNSGGRHGDSPADPYYALLPITVRPARVTYPFTVTAIGRAMGFLPADVNCCPTHNTFERPSAASALHAVDTDAAGRIVTLFGNAPRFSQLGEPPITRPVARRIASNVPSSRGCIRGRRVTIRLRRPRGIRFSRAGVYVNGKRVKRLRGRRVTRPFRITLRAKRSRVRIVIITTGKRKIVIRRTYRRCG
jgi:hypothetical protein